MYDANDSEVWGMFERLNRYTFTVKRSGATKRTVFGAL